MIEVIEARLEEVATGSDWFNSLSKKQQEEYLRLHPRSKIGKAGGAVAPKWNRERLMKEAARGNLNALNHPDVAKLGSSDRQGKLTSPLHQMCEVPEAFNHPMFSKVKDSDGSTPLHKAAVSWRSPESTLGRVLQHPDVSKVKDTYGNTPLHSMAVNNGHRMYKDILKHPDVATVKNRRGETPLDQMLNWTPGNRMEMVRAARAHAKKIGYTPKK